LNGTSPGNVLVAFSNYVNCGGSNSQQTEVWRNTNYGIGSFTRTLNSCANSWVFPRLTSTNIPGWPAQPFGVYHLHVAAVALPKNGTIIPYECRSTDGGATWPTCSALSAPYNPQPLGSPWAQCYAGDYQGAAADPAHNRSFFAWAQPLTLPNLPYAIYGNTNDL